MEEKILTDKLIECFESIKNNIFEGFSGFLEMNKNSFLLALEKDILNKNQEDKDVLSNLVNSQYLEIFDMIFCELYFENKSKKTHSNYTLMGNVFVPLSTVSKFHLMYNAKNNYTINLMEVDKFTKWILSEIPKGEKIESIYISDRLEDGHTEYISYSISF